MAAIGAETTRIEWFGLNADAILEIVPAVDMVQELHQELTAQHITFARARVKQDLCLQLTQADLLNLIGQDRLYPTLHTAIAACHSRERLV